MAGRLCFLTCEGFRAELEAAIAAEGWADVSTVIYPCQCGHPPLDWQELRRRLPENCTRAMVLGHACIGTSAPPPEGSPPIQLAILDQCFHLVAPALLVDEAIQEGAYLMTPTWLRSWRGQLARMGFTADNAGEFFRDFATGLVLLDTGLLPDAPARLAELAKTLGLPARRLPVGLEPTRLQLARWVAEWRLAEAARAAAEQDRRHAQELADHLSAMDLLARLARITREAESIAAIEDFFRMLCAPEVIHYVAVENGLPVPGADPPPNVRKALGNLDGDYAWTPSGRGFLLRIAHGERLLGLMMVDRLAFPEHRERYLNLALAMVGVCALSIESARTHKRLVEAEKMAALGTMVAGVAHEINTPLGICLATTSSLDEQSERLMGDFAAQRMTRSELANYLDTARAAAPLVRANLERIGRLLDDFRQVAVQGEPPPKRRFSVRDCLTGVIESFGDRLSAERVKIAVDCPEGLSIDSVAGDWATIFSNLLGNSLRHGFKGRERGCIAIAIRQDAAASGKRLTLDYRDDGNGIPAAALPHIFDPFYSTDLQQGMGLGLHLVYNLVTHRLGGHITCDSQPGQGAHFHLDVPL